MGQSTDSRQVSNHGKGSQCPDGLAREESNHQDMIAHSPVANGGHGALSFGFGLGPDVGRQHRPQERGQSEGQGGLGGQEGQMPDEKVREPVQFHGGEVGQCPDDKEISIPVQRRVEYGPLPGAGALSPRQITVQVVENVAQGEEDPSSP